MAEHNLNFSTDTMGVARIFAAAYLTAQAVPPAKDGDASRPEEVAKAFAIIYRGIREASS